MVHPAAEVCELPVCHVVQVVDLQDRRAIVSAVLVKTILKVDNTREHLAVASLSCKIFVYFDVNTKDLADYGVKVVNLLKPGAFIRDAIHIEHCVEVEYLLCIQWKL